jgi:hypothetical protein
MLCSNNTMYDPAAGKSVESAAKQTHSTHTRMNERIIHSLTGQAGKNDAVPKQFIPNSLHYSRYISNTVTACQGAPASWTHHTTI